MTLVGNLAIGAVLLYGGLRVIDHQMQVGVLVTFLLYLQRFFDPLQSTCRSSTAPSSRPPRRWRRSPGCWTSRRRCPSPTPPAALPGPAADAGAGAAGRCSFDAVRFGYRETVVLPDLDLTIPAGQTVALVGATGAGKTTIARLLARMYDPREGRVLLDGVDLRAAVRPGLRHEVVLITQENFLFSGTIADNIALGQAGRQPGRDRRGRDRDRRGHVHPGAARTATTSRWASAAGGCRPGSAS